MIEIIPLASGSSGNCYRISDGRTPLLLECGIPWKQIQQGLNFKTSELAGCLVSHSHLDHSGSAQDVMKAGIDVYMSHDSIMALNLKGHRLKEIAALKQFNIGTWTVLPFETQHDCPGSVGFLLANTSGDKLLFATDTYYIRYKFRGLTHIMIECNSAMDILKDNMEAGVVEPALKNRILKSHFSLEHVKEFLKANDLRKVREIWLLHLSDGNSDAERFKREIQQLTGKPVYVASKG